MIEIPTVLILGAGASVHLGYPVGSDLKNEVCGALAGASAGLDPHITSGWSDEDRQDLAMRLGNSGYASVDAFLAANQDCMELGKAAIVDRLMRYEEMAKLQWPFNVGWYDDLFRGMQTANPEDLTANEIAIVTFNYDRSLEVFLTQRVRYHYNLEEAEAVRLVQSLHIIHPHGLMGVYPDTPYRPGLGEGLAARAASIKIISELQDREDDFCSPEFAAAHMHLLEARTVYFLGFGFHDDNMRRLRFFPRKLRNIDICSTNRARPTAEQREFQERVESSYGLRPDWFEEVDCDGFFTEARRLR